MSIHVSNTKYTMGNSRWQVPWTFSMLRVASSVRMQDLAFLNHSMTLGYSHRPHADKGITSISSWNTVIYWNSSHIGMLIQGKEMLNFVQWCRWSTHSVWSCASLPSRHWILSGSGPTSASRDLVSLTHSSIWLERLVVSTLEVFHRRLVIAPHPHSPTKVPAGGELGLLADLKEAREVLSACWVEVASITR